MISRMLGTLEKNKFHEEVGRNFCWPDMKESIEGYVRTCLPCKCNKRTRDKRNCILSTLKTPEGSLPDIAIHIISSLQRSCKNIQILVIVNGYTEISHFLLQPTDGDTAMSVYVFLLKIWQLHRLATSRVPDSDSMFTFNHSEGVLERIGIGIQISVAFHAQTDNQTE